jgi:tetratricopeptide (TPR) repeat protein
MNQPVNETAIPAGCRRILQRARQELERTGNLAEAARLLNRMKVCPDLKMLERIPDRYLNVRHRLQKLDAMRNLETMSVFYRRARGVRRCLERNKYYHSMLQAGFVEASALSWVEHPERGLKLIDHLIRVTPKPLNRFMRFRLTYYRGRYLADMLRTEEAMACARQCEELIKSLNHYDIFIKLSQLYSSLGHYLKARDILEKAWARYHPKISEEDRICHAVYAAINGDYRSALSTMRKLTGRNEKYQALNSVILAYCAIGSGDLERALELSRQAVARARREGFLNVLQGSIVVQACV